MDKTQKNREKNSCRQHHSGGDDRRTGGRGVKKDMHNLLSLVGEKQVKYVPLLYHTYTQKYDLRGNNQLNKIRAPDYLVEQYSFTEDELNLLTFESVSTETNILHAILFATYPKYRSARWEERHEYFIKTRDSLRYKLETEYHKMPALHSYGKDEIAEGLSDNGTTIAGKYYVSYFFDINLIIIDSTAVNVIFYEPVLNKHKATLVLYETDEGWYYVVSYSGNMIFTPDRAVWLEHIYSKTSSTNPHQVKISNGAGGSEGSRGGGKSEGGDARSQYIKHLMKFNADKLREMAIAKNIVPMKLNPKKKGLIPKTKSELCADLSSVKH